MAFQSLQASNVSRPKPMDSIRFVFLLEKEGEKKRQTVFELENTTPEDMWKADFYGIQLAWVNSKLSGWRTEMMLRRRQMRPENVKQPREAEEEGLGVEQVEVEAEPMQINQVLPAVIHSSFEVSDSSSRGGPSDRGAASGRGRGRGHAQSTLHTNAPPTTSANVEAEEVPPLNVGKKRKEPDSAEILPDISAGKGSKRVQRHGASRSVQIESSEEEEDSADDVPSSSESDYETDNESDSDDE